MPPVLPDLFRLVVRGTVGSTNEEARLMAEGGAPAGTLVWAERQTGGRARRGRGWSSPAGNLYCSLLLRPKRGVAEAPQLSFVAALAIAESVEDLLPSSCQVRCKWPNDVLVDGRKISGILLESHASGQVLDWLVMGMGINVAWRPEDGDVETPATCLHEMAGTSSVAGMLRALCTRLAGWLAIWESQGFSPVRQAWLARAQALGRTIRVRLATESFEGIFEDLGSDGTLVVAMPAGDRRRIAAGDVFLR